MKKETKAKRPPARLITIMWGDGYCDRLLDVCLPAIMAPGNLPALVKHFDCELVLITETRLYERLRATPIVQKIESLCGVRLVSLDDLVEGNVGYGMALTYALHRGFDDLGEKMKDYFLIFFNVDFIIADGSYQTLAKHMLAGERLIFAPSYCVGAEPVLPQLKANVDPETHALALSKRTVAHLGIAYRHNTVRAKTINQPLFHMHVTDQFYWLVDQRTMLGHQLPIAIVCMKPQQVYTDPICFWDYATISNACPTANRCVLGDSDDFVMIELRDEWTFAELMTIGRTTVEEIAKGLGDYMTADQLEMGRYPLTLHSADLPDNVESERAKLRRVVDRVYRLLPKEPVSPVDHKFWVGQVKDYEAELDQARKSKAATAYRAHIIEASRRTPPPAERGAKLKPGGARRNPSPRRKHSILAARIYDRLFGRVPKVTRWHPLWADLHIAVDHIDRALSPGKARSLILTNQKNGLVSPYVEEVSEEYLKLSPMELLLENLPLDAKDFDLCFCEFEWVEAFELRSMYHLIHPRMKKHAKIMIYHSSSVLRTLQKNGIGVLTGIAPVFDTAVFYFSGSRASAKMADSYRKWIDGLGKYGDGPRRLAKHGKWMVANAPKAWLANRDAARYSPFEVSDMRTSFVMEIEVE